MSATTSATPASKRRKSRVAMPPIRMSAKQFALAIKSAIDRVVSPDARAQYDCTGLNEVTHTPFAACCG